MTNHLPITGDLFGAVSVEAWERGVVAALIRLKMTAADVFTPAFDCAVR